MNINQAVLIVLVVIIIAVLCASVFTKKIPVTHTTLTSHYDNPTSEFTVYNEAQKNNTTMMRPGSKYTINAYGDIELPPAFIITLHYTPGCTKHQLVMLFEYIAKQMSSDGSAETANIRFERQLVDVTNAANLVGGYPRIVKTRRTGQQLEYTGYTDYGPLRDWILNEGILF